MSVKVFFSSSTGIKCSEEMENKEKKMEKKEKKMGRGKEDSERG